LTGGRGEKEYGAPSKGGGGKGVGLVLLVRGKGVKKCFCSSYPS